MSILIKGMKMPTEGRLMTIYKIQGEFYVLQNGEICPIIELPDHGDLIDRDVLLSKVQKWYWEALETVKRMSTVIPAERSEDPSHPFADSVMKGERSEE